MPPANTPPGHNPPAEPARVATPISFRSALRNLASPVADLASTLGVQHAEDDVDADNVSFLRRPVHVMDGHEGRASPQDRRGGHSARDSSDLQPRADGREEQRERQYQAHREELIRQRRQSQEAFAESMRDRSGPAYGDRVPNHQSLYDWAPGNVENGDADDEEMRRLISEIQQVQPNTHPEIIRALARAQHETRRHSGVGAASTTRASGQQDLRSAAILQSVSRNWRFSHRSRNLMSQYIIDRERALLTGRGDESSTSARPPLPAEPLSETFRQSHNRSPWPGVATSSDGTVPLDRETATVDALRRRYLENPSTKATEFERIIKYLHSLRSSDLGQDMPSGSSAHPDPGTSSTLSMEQETIRKMQHARPYPSSWLTPGMTFEGQQQATPLQPSTLHRRNNSDNHDIPNPRPSTLAPSEPWLGRTLTASPQAQPSASPSAPPDSWTVKVALHSVDYDTMTLQGTMEAFNVPSYSSATSSSPATRNPDSYTNKTTFSTYLTGELIDFTTHTLLTESDKRFALKTTPDVDAAYWRKLEPFSSLSDEEIARALLDRKWIEEQLMGKYILMRWKERCFVRPTFTSFSHRGERDTSSPPHAPSSTASRSTPAPTSSSTTSPGTTPSIHLPRIPLQPSSIALSTATISPSTLSQQRLSSARPTPHPQSSIPTRSSTQTPLPPPTATTSYVPGVDGQGYGLSISGFYYVSLRRSDGHCEGLYFDPQSSPYQRLRLKPMCGGLWGGGAWEVR